MFVNKTVRAMSGIPGGTPVALATAAPGASQGSATPQPIGRPSDIFWNGWTNRMPQFALGGSRAAMLREGGAVMNNNRNSSTNIGNMNVTVPPGADPAGYANGIRQELQRYDNVMNANQGLL